MRNATMMMRWLFVLLCLNAAGVSHASSWAPISPDELKMTSEPKAPGASAIILELQVDRDDSENKVAFYERMKVLTDAGRDRANVVIPYDKENESVRFIEARTIRPDGSILDFEGKIFDKLIVKGKGERYQAKTFSLPEVQVGSIIEYRYHKYFSPYWLFNSRWVLSDELFIKHAKYTLVPNGYYALRWSWPRGLPPGTAEPLEKGGRIHLETHDVPAFVSEQNMPPEIELKYRVDFVYNTLDVKETVPLKFWQAADKVWYKNAEDFMDKKKAMAKVVSQLIQPGDSPEQKLRKIYAHVQQLRNLTYEKEKTEQEEKRDKIKDIDDVADVEKYGYGDASDLTYLYVALARAAGFQSDIAWISTRDQYFFEPDVMNPMQLTSNVAVVDVDGKQIYLEPGRPFIPFGLLPWYESGISGLRLGKDGGTWVKIPPTTVEQARINRKAVFKLVDDALEGVVTVTYTGLDAIDQRLEEMHDDDTARKEYMEDELKRVIVTGADVTMTNQPEWNGVETPLVVEYKVRVPGWASAVGKRRLMQIGLFAADEKHAFEQENRLYPVYFHCAEAVNDDISIELPSGWQVNSVPKTHGENVAITEYGSRVENTNNIIHIERSFTVNAIYLPQKYYPALHEFYQNVRANDEEQIVLSPVALSDASANKGSKTH
ncbi:MAG TPA: DUF3857 domain-containing protein [Steroidobacteraceae bacterium]|nr:DUF3857 domain-containing protein [Steroidobacteraceae bacterium]